MNATIGTAVRPPFTYFGGKTRIAARIVGLLPPHKHYVEPFAGSLAVLLAKPRSALETVNDINGDIMAFWRVLRDQPDELALRMMLTPHSRGEQVAARTPAGDDLERARRVWVTLTQDRSRSGRASGWRHYQDGNGQSVGIPRYLAAYAARVPACAERIAGVSLECRDAFDVIADYGRHASTLLYVDPPYLSGTRNGGANYVNELGGPADHRRLAAALNAADAHVVLSGYESPLYEKLYAGWSRVSLPGSADHGGRRTEVIWSNRRIAADQGALFA